MSFGQRVKVGRFLRFIGDAKNTHNVRGPMFEEMVHFSDHFTDDTLSTDKWLPTVTNATIAVHHSTYSGGMCRILTDNTDNESSFLATPLAWQDDYNAIAEAKILLTTVAGIALYFGFSDATSFGTPDMPIDYAGGTLAAAATNAVGIIVDAADTVNGVSSIVGVGVNGGSLETAVDSAGKGLPVSDWVDAAWHRLRIELNPAGDATFFLDGKRFGKMTTALASATRLCIMVAVANRASAITSVFIDRADGWQDEVK